MWMWGTGIRTEESNANARLGCFAETCQLTSIISCMSSYLTEVSCHSLMEAWGPTIAHYRLLLLALCYRGSQGHLGFIVIHLSCSCVLICELCGKTICVCVSKTEVSAWERSPFTFHDEYLIFYMILKIERLLKERCDISKFSDFVDHNSIFLKKLLAKNSIEIKVHF